jgi:glycosyltransferase involved in cell wall biosynthesis
MENGNGIFRVGIVCGKLGDVDGVSLEVDKWIEVLKELGHEVFTMAGKYGTPLESIPRENQRSYDLIRFDSPQQKYYENLVFPHLQRKPPHLSADKKREILEQLEFEGSEVANTLFEWVQTNDLDVIIAQNTNAMPMTLLGGIGVHKLATERRVATVFHHHDFWWERSRFSQNRIEELLSRIMPPSDPGLEHIVLSSYAAHILRSIKRVHPKVIPNCEDFESPVGIDDYNGDFRSELGFAKDDLLVVQPTRIVRRKRIEDSIEFVARIAQAYPQLADKLHFIISLYQGDEPDENYIDGIRDLAEARGIPFHMISDRVASERGSTADGRKLYTNRDVLAHADLVTYLPIWEGFGNALLEAIAARVPVVTTQYLVYKTDIGVMRFENIEIRDTYGLDGKLIIPNRAVEEAYEVMRDKVKRKAMTDRNFDIGKKEFGYDKLRSCIKSLFEDYGDEIRASRKRVQRSKWSYSV